MSDRELGGLSCPEAADLSGLYVLDALEPDEHEQVRLHLATCPEAHREFAEVGGAVPALALLIEPVDAPPALKARVLAAVATEAATTAAQAEPASPGAAWRMAPTAPVFVETLARQRWQSLSVWGFAAAAVVVIAVLGAWSMVLQSRANTAEQRIAAIAEAIAASTDPAAEVAVLRGTGEAQGASGFAAFPPDGEGHIVLVGLRPAPIGQTYQAWYLVDGTPTSAGLMSVGEDGYAVLSGVPRLPGTDTIALTLEVAGGVVAPTTTPIVVGEVAQA
jgi:hypothetical protein